MALTYNGASKTVWGNMRVAFGTIAFDTSYPTGGEAFSVATATEGYLTEPGDAFVVFFPNGGYSFNVTSTLDGVKAFVDGGAEVANTTNLSALDNVQYLIIGI